MTTIELLQKLERLSRKRGGFALYSSPYMPHRRFVVWLTNGAPGRRSFIGSTMRQAIQRAVRELEKR